jgi:hypothetical protein
MSLWKHPLPPAGYSPGQEAEGEGIRFSLTRGMGEYGKAGRGSVKIFPCLP